MQIIFSHNQCLRRMKLLFSLILVFSPRTVDLYAHYDESKLMKCYECEEYITENGHEFRREDKNDHDCRKLKKSSYGTSSTFEYSDKNVHGKALKTQAVCLFAESVGTMTETVVHTKK